MTITCKLKKKSSLGLAWFLHFWRAKRRSHRKLRSLKRSIEAASGVLIWRRLSYFLIKSAWCRKKEKKRERQERKTETTEGEIVHYGVNAVSAALSPKLFPFRRTNWRLWEVSRGSAIRVKKSSPINILLPVNNLFSIEESFYLSPIYGWENFWQRCKHHFFWIINWKIFYKRKFHCIG